MAWFAEVICVLFGHRVHEFETELYGLVFVCTRCGATFDGGVEMEDAA